MASNSYDSGRLNLPFVGICTFGKYPYQPDWDAIRADVAVLGAPFDLGTQWRAGARQGPRSHERIVDHRRRTFSKALYPAIRVGYMVLPSALVGAFRNLAGLVNRAMPVEVQLALAEFIGGGHFATHLRRMRDLYTQRRATFIELGTAALAGLARIDCPDSGMNALAWLEGGRDDVAACRAARAGGIQSYPFSDYTVRSGQPGALILGFSGVPVDRMQRHFDTLARAIERG
jgi:GntR family transcriptional regulator/MocR family aminotransferase